MALTEGRKLTVMVDQTHYDNITKDMYHGQLSTVLRKFLACINEMHKFNQIEEFNNWAFNKGEVLLTQPKEEE